MRKTVRMTTVVEFDVIYDGTQLRADGLASELADREIGPDSFSYKRDRPALTTTGQRGVARTYEVVA